MKAVFILIRKILRITAGVLLICTVFPPLALRVINLFVLLPVFAGVVLLLLPVIAKALKALFGRHYRRMLMVVRIMLITAAVFYSAEFCVIFSNSFAQKAPADSTVIVLGAQVQGNNPTLILLGRINAAGEYLKAHPNAACIASGGRGADETMSEAQCIKDWLIDHWGIASGRIYMDEKSASTSQNMDHSAAMIKSNNLPSNVLIATDGFHQFRAKLLASRRGLKPYALPAKTTKGLVLGLYVRELIGLPKSVLFNR